MSPHLEAAKRALSDASGKDAASTAYQDLLVIAAVQARVATAEALERLADAAERACPTLSVDPGPPLQL